MSPTFHALNASNESTLLYNQEAHMELTRIIYIIVTHLLPHSLQDFSATAFCIHKNLGSNHQSYHLVATGSLVKSQNCYFVLRQKSQLSLQPQPTNQNDNDGFEEINDTIRVRIWRALAPGDELTLKQLGSIVGERQLGDLKDHLSHVEKQAKTLKNKSNQWRERRGLVSIYGDNNRKIEKLRLITRRGKKNIVYIRLG